MNRIYIPVKSITIGESPSFFIFEIKEDGCFMAVTGLIFLKKF